MERGRKKEKKSDSTTLITPDAVEGSRAVASSDISVGKGTEKSDTKQGKGEKNVQSAPKNTASAVLHGAMEQFGNKSVREVSAAERGRVAVKALREASKDLKGLQDAVDFFFDAYNEAIGYENGRNGYKDFFDAIEYEFGMPFIKRVSDGMSSEEIAAVRKALPKHRNWQEMKVYKFLQRLKNDAAVKFADWAKDKEAKLRLQKDAQGNPLNEDGSLKVERINSVDELTDEDFTKPTRNVELPQVPANVDAAIGAEGKPVVIKKNIFEKNAKAHKELTPAQGKELLKEALYNPDLVGQTQAITRPHYWVAVRTSDKNSVVVLEVNRTKDNVEIVGWRKVDAKGLEKMKRQAEREGGQFLIQTPEGAAAALSTLPNGLSSEGKGTEESAHPQENSTESAQTRVKNAERQTDTNQTENVVTPQPRRRKLSEQTRGNVEHVADDAGVIRIVDKVMEQEDARSGGALKVDYDMTLDDAVKAYEDGKKFSLRGNLTDEEREIIERAKKDGTYMKAPNGKDTNLTEKQWAQVRTKAFKEWFDDREKAARIAKLRESEPIVSTGKEYEGKYVLNNKSAADYINRELRGEYVNKDTNTPIKITRKGAFKVTRHDAEKEAHLKSVALIPQMIENAIFISEEANAKRKNGFDSYRYYVVGLKMDDVDYTAKLVVGTKKGETYYDHALTEIKKTALIDGRDEISSSFTDNGDAVSNGKDKRLLSILQINSSKVVDENGEPLVVDGTFLNLPNADAIKESINKLNKGTIYMLSPNNKYLKVA